MKKGYQPVCPRCGDIIPDFRLTDEWFCSCGKMEFRFTEETEKEIRMKNGYVVQCPRCAEYIDEFSLSDEWFCPCGESGILDYEEDEEEDNT